MLNVTAVTSLIGKYKTKPSIFYSNIIPQDCTGKTINYYAVTPANGRLEYTDVTYTVNCRSEAFSSARAIAEAVFDTLNRQGGDGFLCYCSILPVAPPLDDRDNFNCPVEVQIKMR
jgi:hypothetical protein